MSISDFIKKEEGLRLKAYLDQAGIPTIGYGTIIFEDGRRVKLGDTITPDVAESLLNTDIGRRWSAIKHVIKVPTTDNQKIAIISLVYNIGVGGFIGSTLLKRINLNDTEANIRAAFAMWNKITVKGKRIENKGLTARRKREADLFFS